eukprot:2309897-Amphidinium_carterae.2
MALQLNATYVNNMGKGLHHPLQKRRLGQCFCFPPQNKGFIGFNAFLADLVTCGPQNPQNPKNHKRWMGPELREFQRAFTENSWKGKG